MPVPLPLPLNMRHAAEPHNSRAGREDRVDLYFRSEEDDIGLTGWDSAEVADIVRQLQAGSLLSGLALWQDPT